MNCFPAASSLTTMGGENLTRLGVGADARSEVHCRPEQVLVLRNRLPGVEADPHLDGLLRRLVVLGERPLHGDGTLQGLAQYFVYFSGSAINLLWQASEQKK